MDFHMFMKIQKNSKAVFMMSSDKVLPLFADKNLDDPSPSGINNVWKAP